MINYSVIYTLARKRSDHQNLFQGDALAAGLSVYMAAILLNVLNKCTCLLVIPDVGALPVLI